MSCLGQSGTVLTNIVKSYPANLNATVANLTGNARKAEIAEQQVVPYLVYALWAVR